MKIQDIIEGKSENRELWDRIKSKGVVPSIDRERYTDLSGEGLEGPFRMKNGQVLYYDPKEGKYYNRDTDMYVDYDDYRAMNEEDAYDKDVNPSGKPHDKEAAAKRAKAAALAAAKKTKEQGVAEGMSRAVDAKGRTQGQWIKAVKTKFPDAKIIQSKMIDGPIQALLADGRTLTWKKVEQVEEIIDPTGATAKALRYIGRKFATAFPWLAVGGVGAGLAATGLMAPIVASMGGVTTALSALSAEMAFSAGMAGTYAAPSIIQTIKDLFAADENSIQAGIKRWVEKYVGDEQDVQEFMSVHSKAAYEGKPSFRWRAEVWPVKLKKEQAEAYLEKNEKSWLDYEKQKAADADKAKVDVAKAEVKPGQGVAEGDKRPDYVVKAGDKPKKVKPSTGGSSTHPYKGKLVGEADSPRVDSLVIDSLKIMRGPELADAVRALKTVLGDREFSSRRGHYNFFIRQMMDMYKQQGT